MIEENLQKRCEHSSLRVKLTPEIFYSTDMSDIIGCCTECKQLIPTTGYNFKDQITEEDGTYLYYKK